MKKFNVTIKSEEFTMTLPTSLKEITSDYLLNITDNVVVSPYHALIAVVYRTKLMEIVNSAKKSRAMATAIVPLFVKANLGDNIEKSSADVFSQMNPSDKIVIAGSDIERGYQIMCPANDITFERLVLVYNNDADFAKAIITDQTYYYFVDFKLVPINDIKGFYKNDVKTFDNPFKMNKG